MQTVGTVRSVSRKHVINEPGGRARSPTRRLWRSQPTHPAHASPRGAMRTSRPTSAELVVSAMTIQLPRTNHSAETRSDVIGFKASVFSLGAGDGRVRAPAGRSGRRPHFRRAGQGAGWNPWPSTPPRLTARWLPKGGAGYVRDREAGLNLANSGSDRRCAVHFGGSGSGRNQNCPEPVGRRG